jgi:putative transcriptional regulator
LPIHLPIDLFTSKVDLKVSMMTSSLFFENKLLLAMPSMTDPRFERSVIYVCSHESSGAMGLVINRPSENMTFKGLLDQLTIETEAEVADVSVHAGGPVEPGRGFVLHSADYVQDSTMIVSQTLALTATVDVLKALAAGNGPANHLLALGYAGWGQGQLEQEIQSNSWMITEADDEVIFHTELEQKWPRAMAMLGVDVAMLSLEAGHS